MERTIVLPRQRTTTPILAISILLGLLLSPLLERALESWMPAAATGAHQQNTGSTGNSGNGSGNSSSWDVRSMWN